MRRTALWMVVILAAALLGALAGVSWRDRAMAPQTALPKPAGRPETSAPAPASPAQPQTSPSGDPFLHIEGTILSAADPAGRRLWDLRASQLTMDNAKQRVVLSGVSGRFYRGAGVGISFSAPAAVFYVVSRDVEMSGGVMGRTADGRMLRASRIRWNAGTRQIQATGAVTLTQRGVAIHADRLAADAGFDQVRFSGNVLVRVTE